MLNVLEFDPVHGEPRVLHVDDDREEPHFELGDAIQHVHFQLVFEPALEGVEMGDIPGGVGELVFGEQHPAPVG